jgi:hypothetical protein
MTYAITKEIYSMYTFKRERFCALTEGYGG